MITKRQSRPHMDNQIGSAKKKVANLFQNPGVTIRQTGPLFQVDVRVFWVGASQIINQYGTPKWMVKIMENPIKMDDLGGKHHPYFWNHPHGYMRQWWRHEGFILMAPLFFRLVKKQLEILKEHTAVCYAKKKLKVFFTW